MLQHFATTVQNEETDDAISKNIIKIIPCETLF